MAGIPYTEGTGLICRVPSLGLCRHALGFSPWDTCVSSWYEHKADLNILFTGTEDWLKGSYNPPITHSSGSHHCDSPQIYALGHAGKHAKPTLMRQILSKTPVVQEY